MAETDNSSAVPSIAERLRLKEKSAEEMDERKRTFINHYVLKFSDLLAHLNNGQYSDSIAPVKKVLESIPSDHFKIKVQSDLEEVLCGLDKGESFPGANPYALSDFFKNKSIVYMSDTDHHTYNILNLMAFCLDMQIMQSMQKPKRQEPKIQKPVMQEPRPDKSYRVHGVGSANTSFVEEIARYNGYINSVVGDKWDNIFSNLEG